jgi:hypothetical protein
MHTHTHPPSWLVVLGSYYLPTQWQQKNVVGTFGRQKDQVNWLLAQVLLTTCKIVMILFLSIESEE